MWLQQILKLPPPPPKTVQRTFVPQFVFETLRTKNLFWRMQRIFSSACGFSALHILLFLLLIYPLKWNHASSVKKSPTHEPLRLKTSCCRLQNYRATSDQQNWSKAVSELVMNDSANVGSVHCSGGAASYILVSLFIDFWSLGCVLYGTPSISSSIFA
jgi:hypothetical protein